jgi:hypothetical protein
MCDRGAISSVYAKQFYINQPSLKKGKYNNNLSYMHLLLAIGNPKLTNREY